MRLRVTRPLVGLALLLAAPAARASPVVDRLVAIVGETPIFLSDVRARVRPHLPRITAQTRDATERATIEAQAHRQQLDQMIDEELIGRAAKDARIEVTDAEIEAAIAMVGKETNLSPEAILAEVARQGFTAAEYRAEVGRQLLGGRWLLINASRAPGAKPEEVAAHREAERRRLVQKLREKTFIEVRL
jgi:peptidyl-prolyl cis-trans isomerase SurA